MRKQYESPRRFRNLVKYHAEPAGPYGFGLHLYNPDSKGIEAKSKERMLAQGNKVIRFRQGHAEYRQ